MARVGFMELLVISVICLLPLLASGIVVLVYLLARSNGRRCPFCAERIQSEAVVCRHCGRDLTKDAEPPTEEA